MYVLPFAVPGFKWVLVEHYFDPQSNTVVRARDSHQRILFAGCSRQQDRVTSARGQVPAHAPPSMPRNPKKNLWRGRAGHVSWFFPQIQMIRMGERS